MQVSRILFTIIVIGFTGWLSQISAAEPIKNIAAKVNGEIILLDDVDLIIKQHGPALTPLTAPQMRQQRLGVLSLLIDEAIIRQYLKVKGAKIDATDIDKAMLELQAALKTQNKTLAEYLKENHQTEAQLKANIEQTLQMSFLLKSNATEAELKKYFEANRDFFDQTTVRVSQIVIRITSTSTEAEKTAAKEKLAQLRAEIIAGKKDFAAVAKEHSQCPSAPQGGDLGYLFRKFQSDEAITKAAFAMKVGDVSEIIEGEVGYHLLKVTARKAGMPASFERSQEDVKACYTEEIRQNLINQLRKNAKVEILLP